ncbi:hypothetical protein JF544_03405 [Halobacillus kuroshimensis]|uniref:Uncharacterized protein n=1 Tax=Halobacillus kuroshimensis TaxID=302481 RepID=A0ABS3DSE8_9BACI|nr:hypothetical protein [Halobacillus kuroshimensis]MBN8234275.1 hypothetical protein [Halobacillus kuroshimensis]
MKEKRRKRLVKVNRTMKQTPTPIVIETTKNKVERPVKRGGCCLKRKS